MTEAEVRCGDCGEEWVEERMAYELFGATCYHCGSNDVLEVR